jgi:hypothetical protein
MLSMHETLESMPPLTTVKINIQTDERHRLKMVYVIIIYYSNSKGILRILISTVLYLIRH